MEEDLVGIHERTFGKSGLIAKISSFGLDLLGIFQDYVGQDGLIKLENIYSFQEIVFENGKIIIFKLKENGELYIQFNNKKIIDFDGEINFIKIFGKNYLQITRKNENKIKLIDLNGEILKFFSENNIYNILGVANIFGKPYLGVQFINNGKINTTFVDENFEFLKGFNQGALNIEGIANINGIEYLVYSEDEDSQICMINSLGKKTTFRLGGFINPIEYLH